MRAVVEAYRRDGLFERHALTLVETHDEGSVAKRLALLARGYARFARLLLCGQVDAVHAHMAMRGSFWRKSLFARTAQLFGVPVIAHLHGSEFERFYAEQPRWRQRLIEAQLRSSARVLVLSHSWEAFVRGIAPAARVQVLPNYVLLPAEAARPGHAAQDRVQALFLGLVGTRKGVFDLLPALAEALRQEPRLHLQLGGNGDVERARAMAHELGIAERVEFLGWVSGQRKAELLAAADLYVLPSHNEGLPVSVLEAMACGLPVISTQVGGIPELVREGVDGLLVAPGDRAALVQALVQLARDAALRARMGASARERVAQGYERGRVLPQLEQLYAELAAGSVRRVAAALPDQPPSR